MSFDDERRRFNELFGVDPVTPEISSFEEFQAQFPGQPVGGLKDPFEEEEEEEVDPLTLQEEEEEEPELPTVEGISRISNPGIDQATERQLQGTDVALEQKAQAATGIAEAEQQVANVTAAARQKQEHEIQAGIVDEQKQRAFVEFAANARMQGINKAASEIEDFKFDSTRLWGSTGQKIAGLVASFIGGFLAPTLGRNDIQEIIENGIARDMADQRANFEAKKENLKNLTEIDRLAKADAANAEDFRARQRALRLLAIEKELSAHMATVQNPVIQARLQDTLADLALNREAAFLDIRNKEVTRATQELGERRQMAEAERNRQHQARQAAAARAHASALQRDAQNFQREKWAAEAKAAIAAGGADLENNPELLGRLNINMHEGARLKFQNDKDRGEFYKEAKSLQTKIGVMQFISEIHTGRLSALPGSESRLLLQQAQKWILANGENLARASDTDLKIWKELATASSDEFMRLTGTDAVKAAINQNLILETQKMRDLASPYGVWDAEKFAKNSDFVVQELLSNADRGEGLPAKTTRDVVDEFSNSPPANKNALVKGFQEIMALDPTESQVEEVIGLLKKRGIQRMPKPGGKALISIEDAQHLGDDQTVDISEWAKDQLDEHQKKRSKNRAKKQQKPVKRHTGFLGF